MTITDVTVSGRVGADGTAEVRVTPPARQTWTVSQVTANGRVNPNATVGTSATCSLYKGTALVSETVALFGTISGYPPVVLRPGEVLRLRWTAAVVGAAVEGFFIYDDGNG